MTFDMNTASNIVREVQLLTWQRTPNTGLIVTYDTNTGRKIHPGAKMPVGERAARWALAEIHNAKAWGQELPLGWGQDQPLDWRGPVYKAMAVEKGKIIISFEKGNRWLLLDQDLELGFYIAGADRKFHHARVRIHRIENDDKLEVWSDDVPEPVAVRYAWANLPIGGLMNHRELPASPFRTDSWPVVPPGSGGKYVVERK